MLSAIITTIILQIIFTHWVADFVCQTSFQAVNKSSRIDALTFHVLTYTLITTIAWTYFFNLSAVQALFVFTVTFFTHWITDFITSRLNKWILSKTQNDASKHWFFVSVGFDQVLHYIQLFLLFQYITK